MREERVYSTRGPVPAHWLDGKSAAGMDVDLFLPAHMAEIRLCEAGKSDFLRPLAIWPLATIQVVSGKLEASGSEPLRLGLAPDDGARLVVKSAPAKAQIASWLRLSHARSRRRLLRRWAMVCLVVWAVGLLLYLSGPALFSLAATAVPRPVEESLGQNARENVVQALLFSKVGAKINDAASASPELAALMSRLEQGADIDGYTFDVQVLNADFVNAFALPGGYMLVSSGLILDCASPDELAGVLAHEMAHVTSRHGTAGMLRQQVWSTFARLMGLADNAAGSLAAALMQSSFSREQERQADFLGAARLVGAGINPLGMADFFARMEAHNPSDNKLLNYLGSHPPSGERRDSIRAALESGHLHEELARQTKPQTDRALPAADQFVPAMDTKDWARFRALLPEKKTPPPEDAPQEPHLPEKPADHNL